MARLLGFLSLFPCRLAFSCALCLSLFSFRLLVALTEFLHILLDFGVFHLAKVQFTLLVLLVMLRIVLILTILASSYLLLSQNTRPELKTWVFLASAPVG